MSHFTKANTYGGLIKRIPKELGVIDFREFTYEQYQLLMNQYKGSKTNSYCIASLFFAGITRECLMELSRGSYSNGTVLVGNEYMVVPDNIEIAKDNTNGYDILSYTNKGQELHIEVKTTPGTVDTPFYISKNE